MGSLFASLRDRFQSRQTGRAGTGPDNQIAEFTTRIRAGVACRGGRLHP
jgi:hypothetical protein